MSSIENSVWINWHYVERERYKDLRIVCNHYLFEFVAKANKLKTYLQKAISTELLILILRPLIFNISSLPIVWHSLRKTNMI